MPILDRVKIRDIDNYLPFYLLLIGKRISSYSISILTLKQVTIASDVPRNTEDTGAW